MMEVSLSKSFSRKYQHHDQDNVNHISMNIIERLCFRMGLLSHNTLQNDITNRITKIKQPMTIGNAYFRQNCPCKIQ